jgi:hypothetical protein
MRWQILPADAAKETALALLRFAARQSVVNGSDDVTEKTTLVLRAAGIRHFGLVGLDCVSKRGTQIL